MQASLLQDREVAAPAAGIANPANAWLALDDTEYSRKFSREPFLIGHRLCDHPLFEFPRLLDVAKSLPESLIEYNAGDLPVNQDQTLTPRNGLTIEETIRRIEECKSWMVLKHVEHDADYAALLEECLVQVRPLSNAIVPGMRNAHAYIFITSPGSVTPYHMDPEHNFLLQIRGSKTIRMFDGRDRSIVSERDLERFYGERFRNMTLSEENRTRGWEFQLPAGAGLHFPVTYPHWVQNSDAVSISFSITWRTPDLERRANVYGVNGLLRRRGLSPTPYGRSPWKDSLKYFASRVSRKLRGT